MLFVHCRGTPLASFLGCSQQAENVDHFEFQLREQKKSAGVRSGEYGVRKTSVVSCFARQSSLSS